MAQQEKKKNGTIFDSFTFDLGLFDEDIDDIDRGKIEKKKTTTIEGIEEIEEHEEKLEEKLEEMGYVKRHPKCYRFEIDLYLIQ